MVKVECDGCKAPYQIDEKRIPPAGLKMRCPKCGTNLVVMKPGSGGAEADLPAPAPARPDEMRGAPPRPAAPRPAAPRAAAPPPPEPQRESHAPISSSFADIDLSSEPPPARPSRGGFGDIDLMGDLPPSDGFSLGEADPDFGSQDLPAIQAAPPPKPKGRGVTRNRTMDLGVDLDEASFAMVEGAEMEAAFGDVDLPAVHADGGLPGFPGGGMDLPSPLGSPSPFHGAPRAPSTPPGSLGFGDIDLPAPPHGGGGFGEIDLPTATDESGFPAPRGREPSFGHIDLPLPFNEAALPAVAPAYGLPSPAAGSGLPSPAHGGAGLPLPSAGPALPSPAFGGSGLPGPPSGRGRLASSPSGELPAALQGGHRAGSYDPHHGEMDLDGDAPRSSAGGRNEAPVSMGRHSAPASMPRSAFDDSDRAVSTTAGPNMDGAVGLDDGPAPAPVGDEVDISGSAMVDGGPVRSERTRPATKPAKSGRSRRVVILTAVALAVGGGALALEPSIGPFGVNFISDRVNAKGYAARLDTLRTSVQADFDEDTAVAATRAFTAALAAQVAVPRHRPTAAYAAYVALARGLRFGHRTEDDTRAAQLLATAGVEPSDALTLALAAQAAGKGQLPEARKLAADLLQRSPKDVDAADLAGEIELAAKAPEAAVKAWKQAAAARGEKKSARALFGLARAEAAAGNTAGAEASARAAIAASPTHAGARTLLASLLGQAPEGEAEALTLLKAVTEDATVRGASSDADLIDAYTLIGRIHLTRSRVSAAEQAFAAALKLDPQAVQALIGNGELFYRSGRNSEALARFEAATRADTDNVIAKVGVAKTWLALERMKEAKDLLKAQRAAHPGESLVLYWLGRSEEALGNKKEAEAAYTEAIKVGGVKLEVVDAYVAAARLLSGAGRTDDAAQMLAEASKKFPDLAALHRAKGDVALQSGRYEEARDEFKTALEHDEDLGTRFKLGVALRRMRAFAEAAAVFDAIGAVDKDYPGLALERGLMFEETGQSDKALESYSDALRKAPDDVDLKLRVGSTQVIAGHAQQAESILREVVKARAGSAEANHFLGRALLAKGANLAEAMKFLDAAVNIDGNRAEYHLYVGWAANDTGQPARAEAALKRALELDKGLGDAYWQRGILRQKSGEANDALQDLKTALEKRPSRFEAYATMAFCYQDLLRWPEAESAWRSAIAGNPAVPEWHYRLGKILASHGSVAASAPELEQAVKLAEAAQPLPGWLYDAHLLLAEAVRGSNKPLAIESYRRFLELAPRDSPYVAEAERALTSLGSSRQR